MGSSFEPSEAWLLIESIATIAAVLNTDRETLQSEPFQWCKPLSIFGIASIACSAEVRAWCLQRIIDIDRLIFSRADDVAVTEETVGVDQRTLDALHSKNTIRAFEWLDRDWQAMPPTISGSIVATMEQAFGSLRGAGNLRDMFCVGLPCREPVWGDDGLQNVDCVTGEPLYAERPEADILHCLGGGILLNAVSDTEWGFPGYVISLLAKESFRFEAKRRLAIDPESCKRSPVMFVMDGCEKLMNAVGDSDVAALEWASDAGIFLVATTPCFASLGNGLGADWKIFASGIGSQIFLKRTYEEIGAPGEPPPAYDWSHTPRNLPPG